MPPKPPLPPAHPKPPAFKSPSGASKPTQAFGISSGVTAKAQKVVIYGPGGVGKTELAANLKQIGINPLFADVEDGSRFLDIDRLDPSPSTFDELRAVAGNAELLASYDALIIDSLTKVEELCITHVLGTVKHEKGHAVTSIDGYGWGKGFGHVYDAMLILLSDLDAVARSGKHVICITHECTAKVPNPGGEDWIQYQPRLQSTPQGMIRERVKEWCDHLFRVEFDVFVDGGKAQGSGSRTIHPTQMPTHWAKSRTLSDPIPYERGSAELWKQLKLSKGGE